MWRLQRLLASTGRPDMRDPTLVTGMTQLHFQVFRVVLSIFAFLLCCYKILLLRTSTFHRRIRSCALFMVMLYSELQNFCSYFYPHFRVSTNPFALSISVPGGYNTSEDLLCARHYSKRSMCVRADLKRAPRVLTLLL